MGVLTEIEQVAALHDGPVRPRSRARPSLCVSTSTPTRGEAFPRSPHERGDAMTNTDTNAFIDILRQQLTNAPEGVDTSALAAAINALASPEEERVKIWFLLDRSGSMQHLAEDVIGGFNQFLTDQAAKPGKVRMTAVQFDGQDPFEVIYDAQHVTNIKPLTSDTYSARGVTPLYDAVGTLIERADARLVKRAKDGCPLEDQLVLVFTDGLENASHRFDRAQVFDMIKNRMDDD